MVFVNTHILGYDSFKHLLNSPAGHGTSLLLVPSRYLTPAGPVTVPHQDTAAPQTYCFCVKLCYNVAFRIQMID